MISVFSTKPDMRQNRKITIKRTTSTGSDFSITPTSPVVRNPPRGPGVIRRHRSTGGNSGFRINPTNSPSDRNPQVANCLSKNDILTSAREVSSDDDSSDDSSDSEVDEREPQLTQSLGRNAMRRIMPSSNLPGRPLAGKVIDVPVNDIPLDPRIQRTVQNYKTSGRLPGGKVQTKGCVINPIGVTRPGGYSKGGTAWKQSSPSPSTNTTSPKRSGSANANQHLRMTTSGERSPSPGGGKSRIESNPFFQNDRLKQSSSKTVTARDRVGSAPLLDTPKQAREKNKPPEIARLTSPIDSRSPSPGSLSPQLARGNPSKSLSVQSRIKMWAILEKERKEKQERKSPETSPVLGRKVKSQSEVSMKGEQSPRATEDELYDDVIPISTSHTETGQTIGDDVYDDVLLSSQKHNSPETSVVAEIEEAFYEDMEFSKRNQIKSAPPPDLRNISDDLYTTIPGEFYQNSCQTNEDPPNLPPRPGSLRCSDQQSESQPHVYDEEMYDDIERQKSSPSKASPKKGNLFSLGWKTKNKEKNENSLSPKSMRSKWKMRSPILGRRKKNSKSDSKDSEEGLEIRNPSKIGSRQSKKRVAVKRHSVPPSDAQPDGGRELETSMEASVTTENGVDDEVFDMKPHSDSIDSTDDKLSSSPLEGLDSPSYFTVSENQLDPHSEKFVSEVSSRPVPKRSHAMKDHTLSREIYDIINSMASPEPDDGTFSPLEEKAVAETSQQLLQSNCLSAPASNRSPILLITNSSSSPTPTPFQNGFSSPSSDDTNSARNSLVSDVDPEAMESSLDRSRMYRSAIKKQISEGGYDPTKTIVSASLMEKYLSSSPTLVRKGSLTPEEVSHVCVCVGGGGEPCVWVGGR